MSIFSSLKSSLLFYIFAIFFLFTSVGCESNNKTSNLNENEQKIQENPDSFLECKNRSDANDRF